MNRLLHSLTIALLALGLGACETVDKRIARDQAYFDQLPAEQQGLIRNQTVSTGMPARDVILAWGRPDRVLRGEDERGPRERWVYLITRSYTYHRPVRYYDHHPRHSTLYYEPYTVHRRFVVREAVIADDRVREWTEFDEPVAYEAYPW